MNQIDQLCYLDIRLVHRYKSCNCCSHGRAPPAWFSVLCWWTREHICGCMVSTLTRRASGYRKEHSAKSIDQSIYSVYLPCLFQTRTNRLAENWKIHNIEILLWFLKSKHMYTNDSIPLEGLCDCLHIKGHTLWCTSTEKTGYDLAIMKSNSSPGNPRQASVLPLSSPLHPALKQYL